MVSLLHQRCTVKSSLSGLLEYDLSFEEYALTLRDIKEISEEWRKEVSDLWAEQRTQSSSVPLKLSTLDPYEEYWICCWCCGLGSLCTVLSKLGKILLSFSSLGALLSYELLG